MSGINSILKSIGVGAKGQSQAAHRYGKKNAAGQQVVAQSANTKAKPDFITLSIVNNNANDAKYFSLMAQPHLNYGAYTTAKTGGGTWPIQTDNGADGTGAFVFTPQNDSGTMAGLRWLIAHQKPYFVGFAMMIPLDAQATQFNNKVVMLEGDYDATNPVNLTVENIAGKSNSSFEQQTRVISRAFVLDEGNDLVFLLNAATTLTLVFNVASFDNSKRHQ